MMNSKNRITFSVLTYNLLLTAAVFCTAIAFGGEGYFFLSPYENIDWERVNQYHAQFHAHSLDGDYTAENVSNTVYAWQDQTSLDIFSITDKEWAHENMWFPWEDFNVDMERIDMLGVPGEEATWPDQESGGHHIALFITRARESMQGLTFEEALEMWEGNREGFESVEALNFFAHPNDPRRGWHAPNEWYLEKLPRYDNLLGLEIWNHGRDHNQYLVSAEILHHAYQDYGEPAFGFSTMDTRDPGDNAYQVILAEDRTSFNIINAMRNGEMFWVVNQIDGVEPPKVTNIDIDHQARTIDVEVEGDYDEIRWIYGKRGSLEYFDPLKNHIVARGSGFDWDRDSVKGQKYVRFEVVKKDGGIGLAGNNVVGSQAFLSAAPSTRDADLKRPVIYHDDFSDTDNWSEIVMDGGSSFYVEDGTLVVNNYPDRDAESENTTSSWIATDVKEEFNFFERELTFEFRGYAEDRDDSGGAGSSGNRRRRGIAIMAEPGAPSDSDSAIPGIFLEMRFSSNGNFLGFANLGDIGRTHNQNVLLEQEGVFWSADLISLTLSAEGYKFSEDNVVIAEGSWTDSDTGADLSAEGWENGASIVIGEWHYRAPGQYESKTMFDSITVVSP